jgi:hypothetical protein
MRVPGPQRPLTAPPLTPTPCTAPAALHTPALVTWSAPVTLRSLSELLPALSTVVLSNDEVVGVANWWSYQPSESS